MSTLSILKEAYNILDKSTPLRTDCGRLCKKACCQPGEAGEDSPGMLLFPREDELLKDQDEWLTITPTTYGWNGHPLLLGRCTGSCPRVLRPLSCRIFPLTPYINARDILQVKMDPRAGSICPLAQSFHKNQLDPSFLQGVRRASRLLMQDPLISRYIIWLSRMLDEYAGLPFAAFHSTLC
jgi:hypothetical protein